MSQACESSYVIGKTAVIVHSAQVFLLQILMHLDFSSR